jgi:quinol monooxygenase YgiN
MNRFLQPVAATFLAALLSILAPSARSQDAPHSLYAVAYIEILPGKEKHARGLIADYVTRARRAAGALAISALVRTGYPNQFALVEQWQTQMARDDYGATPPAQQFRAALAKLEDAGVDERVQGPLYVESEKPAALPPIIVMTHIDIIPSSLEQGRARIKQLVDSNRHQNSNVRFDVLVQTNRQNHMTLIEGWKFQRDKDAESAARDTVSYRHDLGPMSGSPYDERFYRQLVE